MCKRLEGKVALVTGSTSGIGLATANLFSQEGARVVLTGRRRKLGEEGVRAIQRTGGDASYFEADFSDMAAVRGAVRFTLDSYGRIDILVNNTVSWATAREMPVTRIREEDWDYALAVGLKAPYVACQEAIPAMVKQGGGSIIMMGSVRSFLAFSEGFVYDIVKAGLANMARQLTVDFGRQGIRANVLCPGWIVTNPEELEMKRHDPIYQVRAKIMQPVGRAGVPLDVARAAVFLASGDSNFVAGAMLVVDGGLTIQTPGSFFSLMEKRYGKSLADAIDTNLSQLTRPE
jgi:NAD(P)-dependent dehydrogenase (short-subunit alcohol dehydrogenase family)